MRLYGSQHAVLDESERDHATLAAVRAHLAREGDAVVHLWFFLTPLEGPAKTRAAAETERVRAACAYLAAAASRLGTETARVIPHVSYATRGAKDDTLRQAA
ncbi:MAG: hypothetical protein H6722_32730 [Sandaracinus sp.]|nr:hypothetical protein [Myxococcales bacterium]MCB9617222.1 hypothetical protein [Sandaracinus sp.]MCB9618470.1 hypothetical protein [Sandaracinus sp.]